MNIKDLSSTIIEFFEKLSSWEDSVVRGTGLTTAQMHTIEIVGEVKSIKMKDLAEKIGVTTGTLTVNIDRLESKNLLRRTPHQTDRRSYLIELTKEGKDFFSQHHKYHLKMTEELVSGLTEKEQNDVALALQKMISKI